MSNQLPLGQIIITEQQRDAIHVAVAPVVAGQPLCGGDHVGLDEKGEAVRSRDSIGVVDPFLREPVKTGQRFWLFLYPGTITSLRHDWSHPAFPAVVILASGTKADSEQWMKKWAKEHMGYDYYKEDERDLTEEEAMKKAIDAGHNMSVGPYESARDYIDNEWWNHWEIITGCKGEREPGSYFSCSC